jgi:rubredoxin
MTYTCSDCGGTFESDWSDEEAREEAGQAFPDVPREEQCVVCDDCWRKMKVLAGDDVRPKKST